MKAFLLYPDQDFDLEQSLPGNYVDLTQDLELEVLFSEMAGEDGFLFDITRKVVLAAADNDTRTILYRQEILRDCLDNADTVRRIYDLSVELLETGRKHRYGYLHSPGSILSRSVEMLRL